MTKILALLAALTAALALPVLAGARTTTAQSTTVTVKATEFKFTLSKKTVPHGTVVFKVTNVGKLPHDFKIGGKKTALLKPHKSATLKVTLKKGKAPYLCTVPGHAAAGMKGTVTVK